MDSMASWDGIVKLDVNSVRVDGMSAYSTTIIATAYTRNLAETTA
jgi:hypothetical protein